MQGMPTQITKGVPEGSNLLALDHLDELEANKAYCHKYQQWIKRRLFNTSHDRLPPHRADSPSYPNNQPENIPVAIAVAVAIAGMIRPVFRFT